MNRKINPYCWMLITGKTNFYKILLWHEYFSFVLFTSNMLITISPQLCSQIGFSIIQVKFECKSFFLFLLKWKAIALIKNGPIEWVKLNIFKIIPHYWTMFSIPSFEWNEHFWCNIISFYINILKWKLLDLLFKLNSQKMFSIESIGKYSTEIPHHRLVYLFGDSLTCWRD